MRLDEIITMGSIDRSLRRNRVSAMGAAIGPIGATAAMSAGLISGGALIALAAGLAMGVTGKMIDLYIEGGSTIKKLDMVNHLIERKHVILKMANVNKKIKKSYLMASRHAIKRLNDDINVYTNEIIKATEKSIRRNKFDSPEELEDTKLFLSYIKNVNKDNRKSLKESADMMNEVVIPAVLVGAVGFNYVRDILAIKGTMMQIKSIYKQAKREGKSPKEYFFEVEDYLWDAIGDLGTSLYRKMITVEVYEERALQFINILSKKDISVLFEK